MNRRHIVHPIKRSRSGSELYAMVLVVGAFPVLWGGILCLASNPFGDVCEVERSSPHMRRSRRIPLHAGPSSQREMLKIEGAPASTVIFIRYRKWAGG